MGKEAVYGFKGRKDYNNPVSGYSGGIASNVFNKMESIIKSKPPRGLFFHNEWPKSLQPKYCKTVGSPPQLNYCIQASCSTYGFLSAWAIAVEDEIDKRGLEARFAISIHDEMWHLCKEEDAKELAYVYQICYARVWGLLHYNLFLNDMPFSRAFMSGVSIDKVLRKSPKASTKTPTFDEYPEKGKELTIFEL